MFNTSASLRYSKAREEQSHNLSSLHCFSRLWEHFKTIATFLRLLYKSLKWKWNPVKVNESLYFFFTGRNKASKWELARSAGERL
jgi:hypothetical protein